MVQTTPELCSNVCCLSNLWIRAKLGLQTTKTHASVQIFAQHLSICKFGHDVSLRRDATEIRCSLRYYAVEGQRRLVAFLALEMWVVLSFGFESRLLGNDRNMTSNDQSIWVQKDLRIWSKPTDPIESYTATLRFESFEQFAALQLLQISPRGSGVEYSPLACFEIDREFLTDGL